MFVLLTLNFLHLDKKKSAGVMTRGCQTIASTSQHHPQIGS